MVDSPGLHEERSIALHAAVAAALRERPEIVARARARLDEWMARGGRTNPLWARWRQILALDVETIAAFLTTRSEEAAWLRKASPFAGALAPRERLRILRATRSRGGSAP